MSPAVLPCRLVCPAVTDHGWYRSVNCYAASSTTHDDDDDDDDDDTGRAPTAAVVIAIDQSSIATAISDYSSL